MQLNSKKIITFAFICGLLIVGYFLLLGEKHSDSNKEAVANEVKGHHGEEIDEHNLEFHRLKEKYFKNSQPNDNSFVFEKMAPKLSDFNGDIHNWVVALAETYFEDSEVKNSEPSYFQFYDKVQGKIKEALKNNEVSIAELSKEFLQTEDEDVLTLISASLADQPKEVSDQVQILTKEALLQKNEKLQLKALDYYLRAEANEGSMQAFTEILSNDSSDKNVVEKTIWALSDKAEYSIETQRNIKGALVGLVESGKLERPVYFDSLSKIAHYSENVNDLTHVLNTLSNPNENEDFRGAAAVAIVYAVRKKNVNKNLYNKARQALIDTVLEDDSASAYTKNMAAETLRDNFNLDTDESDKIASAIKTINQKEQESN